LIVLSLVSSIVGLILVSRSFSSSLWTAIERPNRSLLVVLVTVAALLALTLLVPVVRDLFRFGPIHIDDMVVVLVAGTAVLLFLEAAKSRIFPLTSGATTDQTGSPHTPRRAT
jgi:Ca2+-transporting ATPase